MRRLLMEAIMQHLNDLYTQKRGLDLEWEQEHLKEGRYTLNMVKIDRKVREVISHIKLAEAQKEHMQNKIEGCCSRSFCSYLIKSYIVGKIQSTLQALLRSNQNLLYKSITIQLIRYIDAYSRRPRDYVRKTRRI